jgi:hypothetical protein
VKRLVCRMSLMVAFVSLVLLSVSFSANEERTQYGDNAQSAGYFKLIVQILAIPSRFQWDDNKGYYGETRIPSCAMYSQDEDYGCANTGIVDPHHETVPFRLSVDRWVDRWDEPNLVAGEQPVTILGTLIISRLTPGKA